MAPVPCSRLKLKQSAIVAGVRFAAYGDRWLEHSCLIVSRHGEVVFERNDGNTDGSYTLGQREDRHYRVPAIVNGTDVTGSGHPEMIVSTWSGGAHCCFSTMLFELGSEVKLLAVIDNGDGDLAHFEKRGPTYFYVTSDWTFEYWFGSFAGSPNHEVILQFKPDGKFHVAWDQMNRPAPSASEWKKKRSQVESALVDLQPDDISAMTGPLWNEVLDLIYTGHSDLAWKFVEEAGPRAQQGALPKLADFCSTLKTSDYWLDLERTLTNVPDACATAKAERTDAPLR